MVIEVLTEVAHGASSIVHRDPERLALRDPGGDIGDGWWVTVELLRGPGRREERGGGIASACRRSDVLLAYRSAVLVRRLLRFLCPLWWGVPPPSPPGPACRHWGIVDNSKSEACAAGLLSSLLLYRVHSYLH